MALGYYIRNIKCAFNSSIPLALILWSETFRTIRIYKWETTWKTTIWAVNGCARKYECSVHSIVMHRSKQQISCPCMLSEDFFIFRGR